MHSKTHKDDKELVRGNVQIAPRCLAIVCREIPRVKNRDGDVSFSPGILFDNFVEANRNKFWNIALDEAVIRLKYKGCLEPLTLLIGGDEVDLELIRTAWAQRLLRPPKGYCLVGIGKFKMTCFLRLSQKSLDISNKVS